MHLIANHRNRNNVTQSQIAETLHVDKSYISRVENGERGMTSTMYGAGFTHISDGMTLTDMLNEISQGLTTPTHSDTVYDDHRMSIQWRLKREIKEFKEVLSEHCLDKQPEFLTAEDKENITMIYSEFQDVLFEGINFLNRLSQDYSFITPQQMSKNRDARLKMERRI